MTQQQIFENLSQIRRLEFYAENALEENGGELTEEVEAMLADIDSLVTELWSEGATDDIAREISQMDEEEDRIIAEKELYERRLKAVRSRRERRKATLRAIMDRLPEEEQTAKKVYTIKPYNKTTTKADPTAIANLFGDEVKTLAESFLAEHPDLSLEIKGSVKIAKEFDTMPSYYTTDIYPTVQILKPRKSNKNNGTE